MPAFADASFAREPRARVTAAALAAALLPLAPVAAGAQSLDAKFWVTDGPVHAIAPAGDVVYLGGAFGYVGPPTGSLLRVGTADGGAREDLPVVVGDVAAIVSDGAGGWFVGGSFTRVGGLPRHNLARVRGDGAVADWDPGTDGEVEALALAGGALYVGGRFTRAAGKVRVALAAVDAFTGEALEWNPAPSGSLDGAPTTARVLLVDGDRVVVGGSFDRLGGLPRRGLGAVDAVTGAATAWSADANRPVLALARAGTRLFAGGEFDSLGGVKRARIGALDAASGAPLPWSAAADGAVRSLAAEGAALYAGGSFRFVGGAFRPGLAVLDVAAAAVGAWSPQPNGDVTALAIAGPVLYVGGTFKGISGVTRLRAAALSRATGAALAWDPALGGVPRAFVPDGDGVVLAGRFRSAGGVVRRSLAALDAVSGVPTPWNPGANGPVYSLLVSGDALFVGGSFTSIGGRRRSRLARLHPASGTVSDWDPGASAGVRALALAGNRLLVGGDFIRLGPFERSRIGAVRPDSGTVFPWDPIASGRVAAIAVDSSTVYIAGHFGLVSHQYRPRVAAIHMDTGLPLDWIPEVDFPVHDLALHSGTVYVAGEFTEIGGLPRERLAAIDRATGAPTDWDPGVGSDLPAPAVHALALGDDRVFLGGSFTRVGGLERPLLAAVRVKSDGVWEWNPGATVAPGLEVNDLAVGEGWLYAAGSFTDLGGGPQQGVARFSLEAIEEAGALGAPRPGAGGPWLIRGIRPNPFAGLAEVALSLPRAGRLDARVLDLQGREVAVLARGEWRAAGPGTLAWRAGSAPAGVYLLRLAFEGTVEARRLVHLP